MLGLENFPRYDAPSPRPPRFRRRRGAVGRHTGLVLYPPPARDCARASRAPLVRHRRGRHGPALSTRRPLALDSCAQPSTPASRGMAVAVTTAMTVLIVSLAAVTPSVRAASRGEGSPVVGVAAPAVYTQVAVAPVAPASKAAASPTLRRGCLPSQADQFFRPLRRRPPLRLLPLRFPSLRLPLPRFPPLRPLLPRPRVWERAGWRPAIRRSYLPMMTSHR